MILKKVNIIMNIDELSEFYKQQMELEEQIITAAKKSISNTTNILVKELIQGITFDSSKHKSILTGLLAILEKTTSSLRLISEEEREKLKETLQNHIKLEQKAIETYRKLLHIVPNTREKVLVKNILSDELRHHNQLKWLYDMIIKELTLTEEDIFEMTWKDTIWQDGT
jgi:rubrerythrin